VAAPETKIATMARGRMSQARKPQWTLQHMHRHEQFPGSKHTACCCSLYANMPAAPVTHNLPLVPGGFLAHCALHTTDRPGSLALAQRDTPSMHGRYDLWYRE
jgi:hypothetical protein